ncbi:molybdopterin-dependent oxidoreductase [Telmatospirillum sp.]|uniref:molybdopterin-dependent oxidoreductase n=1 Tax=Telmatospirillum sp. TaxID=2079197 RepID=UPI0028434BA5|nr:molybdopterin-dependent oxidoreductase [Telmatospirillum sp.]MDR3438210.1 molybdopterin-dependent oxidoreductase [Telmatospirillum sp.]
MAETIRTTCPYCGVGCGVLATPTPGGGLEVAGDPDHPANRGRLCVKGQALGETVGLEGRLLHPVIDGRPAGWEDALARVAGEFARTIREHGPDSVAFYVSGQLLTEDYYVANKLMKGFIGSANIDTNSRLCMSSSVAGHVRAFGSDTVPGNYEDLELADLVVLVGSNTAWCHPVLFQRIQAAKAARPKMKLVVIDPRRTATAQEADLHLALRPGSDVALFNGLLAHLVQTGKAEGAYIAAHTEGCKSALAAACAEDDVAAVCDLDPVALTTFYDWFAVTGKTVTVYSQGVNQSSAGSDKVNAIINCHLLTGRIGRPGMGPLSFTGQPNAMGGREVGGLANMLAAHMGFDPVSVDRVRRFWDAPAIAGKPGQKAVDLFQAVEDGRIKALWIMATNPVVSLPDSNQVRRALEACPFVVVSDAMASTDSTVYADVQLPALTWAEKDGTVTNSERRISRQPAVLPIPGQAKADWRIISEVARHMGFGDAFAYGGPKDVFREHCRLSSFENEGRRDFDLIGLIDADYDRFEPVQWPVRLPEQGTARMFGDGRFYHADGRARFVAVTSRPPMSAASEDWPLILNTGRTRDHWHTMTRTGKSPRLASHRSEPWLAIHPADAARYGLAEGDMVRVESPRGFVVLKTTIDDGQREGDVFAPMHWNDQFASSANIGRLIAPHADPVSGQPELKITPVRLLPQTMAWRGLLLSRSGIGGWQPGVVWSQAAGKGHTVTHLSGESPVENWNLWLKTLFGADGGWLTYQDRGLGLFRAARILDGRLDAVFLAAPREEAAALDWMSGLFARDSLNAAERADLLAGGEAHRRDPGATVCSCHQVGRNTILETIASQRLASVEAIGRALRAGTNCGSCIPELRRLLNGDKSRTTAA